MTQSKRHYFSALLTTLLCMLVTPTVLADNATYPFGNSAAQDSQFIGPFDYDFGGYTWLPSGSATISATPYGLAEANNHYDNYIFETRSVSPGPLLGRLSFRYEFRGEALTASGGILDKVNVNDMLLGYRLTKSASPYLTLGWGVRAISSSAGMETHNQWYLASGMQLGRKLGLHYQYQAAVQGPSQGLDQTLYLDYLVGYKSYLMLGYKQQHLAWGSGNSADLSGYLFGVYFKF